MAERGDSHGIPGATINLTVISAILILPPHNPLVVAKAIATLGVMSGARFVNFADIRFEPKFVP